jgi:citrate lyase beta subunit
MAAVLERLSVANREFATWWPGEPAGRQPVHTVYGGAQLYKASTTQKLGELAIRHLDRHAPDATTFCAALGIETGGWLADAVYSRTRAKLEREAVEDFRIDFEDGYGNRPDAEEDAEAVRTATELARAWKDGIAPPFIGIRVKPLTEELKHRSVRTLDLFVSTLAEQTGGQIPDGFNITLPKVTIPEQAEAFVDLLEALEHATGLESGTLKIELMIEATQALLDAEGRSALPGLLRACRGRCTGAHLGTYDFTASANITAQHQVMDHPVCDLAKHLMTLAYAQTGIFLSDGATNVMPVGDDETVHAAWRLAYGHIRHSLRGGYFQGWDLHPGQLSVRYAACYAFFLEGYQPAAERLGNFIDKAAQATLVGDVFDDAATGQGLLNYFLRALNCGAVTLAEVEKTGLTLEEIQGRSFVKILGNRRQS